MRAAWAALCLAGCTASNPFAGPANTEEFIFVRNDGRSFVHVLPADWQPAVEGGFLRINGRQRIMAMDVIMVRPRVQLHVEGLEFVRLARRNSSTAGSGLFDLWVRPEVRGLLGEDRRLDLVQVAPRTWLRPNDFRLIIER